MMNEQQVQQGRDALIALGWEAGSIDMFCKTVCNNEVKREIANGLLPYLKNVIVDLDSLETEITSLVTHIEEFVNV